MEQNNLKKGAVFFQRSASRCDEKVMIPLPLTMYCCPYWQTGFPAAGSAKPAASEGVKESELLKRQITSTTTACQKQLKAVKAEYVKSSKELSKWEGLMLDSIEGTCVFTPEQVKKRMDVVQQSVNDLSAKIEDLQNKATETAALTEEIKAGLSEQFETSSAATSTEEIGKPVYPPVRKLLAEHGINCTDKTVRQLTNADYDRFDLLIGMDRYLSSE